MVFISTRYDDKVTAAPCSQVLHGVWLRGLLGGRGGGLGQHGARHAPAVQQLARPPPRVQPALPSLGQSVNNVLKTARQ